MLLRPLQLDAILAPNTSTVVYTMLCSPSGQGPVNVSIAAGQYQDLANNVNHNATVGLIYDSIPPALNLTTEHPPISNLTVALFTLVITEHVISFTSSNITVVNGVAHNLTLLWCDSGPWTGQGECTYEFLVAPAADGIVTVTLLAGAILDFALNPSLPSVHISFRFDDITLTSFLESQTLPLTNTVLPFSITFSETPFFLDIASFTCRNCTISNLVQVSTVYNTSFTDIYAPDPPAVFTFTVTPVSTLCDIAVYLDGLGVTDRALNGVSQSNSFQVLRLLV